MAHFGITDDELRTLIEDAYATGYKRGRMEVEDMEWLNGEKEVIGFVSPNKPMSRTTFNEKRRKGVFGEAIIGRGRNIKARKMDLMDSMRRYELNL